MRLKGWLLFDYISLSKISLPVSFFLFVVVTLEEIELDEASQAALLLGFVAG